MDRSACSAFEFRQRNMAGWEDFGGEQDGGVRVKTVYEHGVRAKPAGVRKLLDRLWPSTNPVASRNVGDGRISAEIPAAGENEDGSSFDLPSFGGAVLDMICPHTLPGARFPSRLMACPMSKSRRSSRSLPTRAD